MPTTEPTINDALAGWLRKTRYRWHDAADCVRSQTTGLLVGTQAQPDILVIEPGVSPVAVETEVLPGPTVGADAQSRLGQKVRAGSLILSAVAVRLPTRLRERQGESLRDELGQARDFELAVYTGRQPTDCQRWPSTGWLTGGVADLSLLVQSVSIPPAVVEEAVTQLERGVSEAAVLLAGMLHSHSGAPAQISAALCQEQGEQTSRMATTILANAFVFHEALASGPGALADVKSLDQLRSGPTGLSRPAVLAEWRKILQVNYWPIFDIARRILEPVEAGWAGMLIDLLARTAEGLLQQRLMSSHDLMGAVFQKLIADRKFLAAFYTTPAAAALLAGLTITPDATPAGGAWRKADDVAALRIADFACGTGTLLTTAYRRIGQLHELHGGDAEGLHSRMMATALVGCDVLPAAAHLTASMLAGAHPTVRYDRSSILTLAYGKQPGGAVALGSLDLLNPQGEFKPYAITSRVVESMAEGEQETWQALPHTEFDVVLMNPPFTRATGQEGKKIGVPNPMFAAFRSAAEEQAEMSKAADRLTKGTSAHGNAGEASMFLVLADRKLRRNGALGLVMPLSLLAGDAWDKSRALLARNYRDLILISIAAAADADLSFSADTGMGECLVIGRKAPRGSKRGTFVVLSERPALPLLGASLADQIREVVLAGNVRRLEEGPVGGTPLHFGNDLVGQALDAPLPAAGGWKLARIADLGLAQTAYQLASHGRLWLPTMDQSAVVKLPITQIAGIAELGPYHADINWHTADGRIRGPFDVSAVRPGGEPTYPVLWAHDANRERTLVFDADCEGQPRRAAKASEQEAVDQKVAAVWASASHAHFNVDFRFNSQSTAMQFTPRKTIGGRAWVSLRLSPISREKALVLWGNTSLGLLVHWWCANKQQSGRGSVRRLALSSLPVLDVGRLCAKQLAQAERLFDALCAQPLLPLHQLADDPVRRTLDERFGREVLALPEELLGADGPLGLLRRKLAKEPSIRGGK